MRRIPVPGLLAGLPFALILNACSSSSTAPAPDAGKDAAHGDASKALDSGFKKDGKADAGPVRDGASDSTAASDAGDGGPFTVPAAWNATYTQPTDTAAAASRASCTFARGAMPAQTLGPATALDTAIPIEHIVVLMQENRSFDSYLGHLAAYEATKGITNTIESAPDTASNPAFPVNERDAGIPDAGSFDAGADAGTGPFPYVHAPQLCSFDTAHGWGPTHIEYDKGAIDGFYFANNGVGDEGESTHGVAPAQLSGARALWWYDEHDIPFHYSLYSTFAMGDAYYSALLGPTYPNRMYLYSGTSFGLTHNTFPDISAYPTPETPVILFDELAVRNIPFTWYEDQQDGAMAAVPAPDIVLSITASSRYGRNPKAPFSQFLSDAAAGTLPPVSFIDGDNANESPSGDDEHPPSQIQIGQHFVWEVVNAITKSPAWSKTALFIVYDENGGLYDHVKPPSACEPDSLPPVLTNPLDQSQPGKFDQYGFRVPFVVVSPYSKKSYVGHDVYSHTSITRFIEAKFKIPALTARDANADPFTDLFDWKNPPFMTAPTFPEPSVDQTAVAQCQALLTPTP